MSRGIAYKNVKRVSTHGWTQTARVPARFKIFRQNMCYGNIIIVQLSVTLGA
jgi:hypothetical protein